MALDVPQDAFICRGRAPYVMIRLQAVNRDDHVQSLDLRPLRRDGANGAGDELDFDAHLIQLRQQDIQFAEPHQRLAANDREVERAVTANQRQHSVNQLLAFVIGKRAQRPALPEMFGLVSVTSRAAQRALAGDLDRQHRMMAAQNAAPAADNVSFFHCEPLLPIVGVEECGVRNAECGILNINR